MAKKDKKDEEYKDENLHNKPEQDDEDFGLPDLDDENESKSSDDFDSDEVAEDETSFDTSETSQASYTSSTEEEVEYDSNPFGDEEETAEERPVSTYTPPKKQSAAPIIITFSIIIIIAVGLVYYFFLREPKKEVVQEPEKDTSAYVVEKPVEPEPEVMEPEEPIIGEVNTLNSRTGRSYVVVGSFFDDDLARDYADKLIKSGTNVYIIPPFGKSKFNRVAIEETDSFAKASTRATELAGQYKEQPWPLKY
ncbi:SPOR domain-containing protein [Marivirga sp.]|uniref:SPOR domain-containing protein n=1 Tax=Marivirga sp. TaxID=2018662 RepID=UPI002D805C33|nr:SPOR domain-containing protein [Marivirga sp.]HET8859644.1 SPOR domain-containing protein [Marivirga sp.]